MFKSFFLWTTIILGWNLNQWLCNFWGMNKVSFRQVGRCGKKNSSVCPGFVSDCKNAGSADLVEFAFQSCYRNFAPIQQVFDIIGILDLTLRCFMAFIFRSKNRIFLKLIMHSKIRNAAILTAKVTTSQLLRQKNHDSLSFFFEIIFTWQIRDSTILFNRRKGPEVAYTLHLICYTFYFLV